MNKILLTLSLLVGILFCSCGDSHLAKDATLYKPFVIIVPEKYSGNLESIPIQSAIYVEKDQTFRMYLGIIHDEVQFFGDDAFNFVKNVLWNIDGKNVNLPSFKHTFSEAGQKNASIKIVDLWDDTTYQEFNFFVNEPNDIAIEFPYDGYNQVDPLNSQSLPLRWTITGIDDWESTVCDVFASSDRDSIWSHPIASVNCFDDVYIQGSLVSDLTQTKDSSFTFYWAVKATIYSEYAGTQYDSTEIARFSTKISDSLSTIKIPFSYDKYRDNEIARTEISIIAANGDTLTKKIVKSSSETVVEKIRPQSGVKVFVKSLNRSDYAPESLMVDIPEETVVVLETIHLKDNIQPQVSFNKVATYNKNKALQFYLYDDGAGINDEKLVVVIDQDTIAFSYAIPNLQLSIGSCTKECKLQIYGEDYANNPLPNVYWTIRNVSTVYDIKGPFVNEGN